MREFIKRRVLRLLILGATAFCVGCSKQVTETQSAELEQSAAQNEAARAAAAGVAWTKPSGWKAMPSRPMRVATYTAPAAEGDPEDGECAAYFFGPGQGGSVEANLKRWASQFEQPDGRASDAVARLEKRKIAGLNVTTMDLAGTYLASAGPMSPVKEKKPDFRLLGAIVEAPQGSVFFKFTGPAKTVAAAEADFRALLESLRRE